MRTELIVTFLLAVSVAAFAQGSQRWKTNDGKLYFGDTPPPGSEPVGRMETDVSPRPGAIGSGPPAEAPVARGSAPRSAAPSLLGRGFEIQGVSHEDGRIRVRVSFRNATGVSLEWVHFDCTALGTDGRSLATGTGGFSRSSDGPIAPGFEGTREIVIELGEQVMSSVSCRVSGEPL